MIPRTKVSIGVEEKKAVERVLDSGVFVQGEETAKLEEEFSSYLGVDYAVAVNSGTAALTLALKALGCEGKHVIVPAMSFIATGNAVVHAGATPMFFDIEPDTGNMLLPDKMPLKRQGTAAIMPVHLYGHPADMGKIMEFARDHKLKVIEDAAQAHGAECDQMKVGNWSDISCFSLYPTKNMHCGGEGGIVATNDKGWEAYMKVARNHGLLMGDAQFFGFNYRISEIQAAIARVSLRNLDENNEKRRNIAKIYGEEFKNSLYSWPDVKKFVKLPVEKSYAKHVYHLYTILCERRDELQAFLKEKEIESSISYRLPMHKHPAYIKKYRSLSLPNAETFSRHCLSLPTYPELSREEVRSIVSSVGEFYAGKS